MLILPPDRDRQATERDLRPAHPLPLTGGEFLLRIINVCKNLTESCIFKMMFLCILAEQLDTI